MNLLIRNATIIHPTQIFKDPTDILIEDGKVKHLGNNLSSPQGILEFDATGKYISMGWCDTFCSIPDPGFEFKEDMSSAMKTAMQGGFTSLAILPDTIPAAHSKTAIEYWLNNSRNSLVSILPLGAITQMCEGKEPAEMYDMFEAGAVGFSDAYHPIKEAGMIMRSLLYSLKPGAPVYSFPFDESISPGALVHEGVTSTLLGLRGIPSMAEELVVIRDINLAEYTGAHIHFPLISSARSVQLIKEAKAKNIKVTCGVSALHLKYNETSISTFDSNWKLMPPLRTSVDTVALQQGVLDGTIDVITSAHRPQNDELKKVEFEYAEPGVINLQTCFSICNEVFSQSKNLNWINALSVNGLKLLGKQNDGFLAGSKANFTIFDTQIEWEFNSNTNQSKSSNSPFMNSPFTGKAIAVINNNQFIKL